MAKNGALLFVSDVSTKMYGPPPQSIAMLKNFFQVFQVHIPPIIHMIKHPFSLILKIPILHVYQWPAKILHHFQNKRLDMIYVFAVKTQEFIYNFLSNKFIDKTPVTVSLAHLKNFFLSKSGFCVPILLFPYVAAFFPFFPELPLVPPLLDRLPNKRKEEILIQVVRTVGKHFSVYVRVVTELLISQQTSPK